MSKRKYLVYNVTAEADPSPEIIDADHPGEAAEIHCDTNHDDPFDPLESFLVTVLDLESYEETYWLVKLVLVMEYKATEIKEKLLA